MVPSCADFKMSHTTAKKEKRIKGYITQKGHFLLTKKSDADYWMNTAIFGRDYHQYILQCRRLLFVMETNEATN